jgi:hypothetical protein
MCRTSESFALAGVPVAIAVNDRIACGGSSRTFPPGTAGSLYGHKPIPESEVKREIDHQAAEHRASDP